MATASRPRRVDPATRSATGSGLKRALLPLAAALGLCPPAQAAAPLDALERFRDRFPAIAVERSAPAPLAGFVEVATEGGEIFYLSDDGRHLFTGELLDLAAGRNLTGERQAERRARLVAGHLPTFRFPAPAERARVLVVTDVDCPYCRRLHQQLPEYQALGISVDYLVLARGGSESPAEARLMSAACAADPQAALTRAMAGEALPEKRCESRIGADATLARRLRTTGTPAIVLPDGTLVDGYQTPVQLAARLGLGAPSSH